MARHRMGSSLRNEIQFLELRASLTLQETRSIHDSMNIPKISGFIYITYFARDPRFT